uniref:Ureide permease 2 n=1 Tax=Triticum urartu TaxID=4572 RepID=A0A8R7UY28_TRIUA
MLCYSLFAPAFNLATNDQWHKLRDGVPHLVVYTAYFYFCLSYLVVGVALNVLCLYRPLTGVPRSTIHTAGLRRRPGGERGMALLAGLVFGLGNAFAFMAGYAAADSVQGLPLVSMRWGVLLFGEYRRSSRRAYTLLESMLFMFVVAMAVLMASSAHRKP